MKIVVVGMGYVGLSNAVLLAQNNQVVAIDLLQEKINMINNRLSPIDDRDIQEYLDSGELNLNATSDTRRAYIDADYIIISTPTNYDINKNFFDTSSVELVIEEVLSINPTAFIVIKSTIPVGYTKKARIKYETNNIIFSPEFLREGKALYDNLYPSRIIVGDYSEKAKIFANLLVKGAMKNDINILFTNSSEAEAIKLFSNTYLAMRVAFFNELDTYAEIRNLNTKNIIEGICLDPRIGMYYNNPSFGYGGYCLPKDTKQLVANFEDIPQNIMKAIVDANRTRKDHITNRIAEKNPKIVGIYRLAMKKDSDNFRYSAILGIIKRIQKKGIKVIIYDPSIDKENYENSKVISNLDEFLKTSDIILANRIDDEIKEFESKIYTRDIFERD